VTSNQEDAVQREDLESKMKLKLLSSAQATVVNLTLSS
jgi:hypothetical protein